MIEPRMSKEIKSALFLAMRLLQPRGRNFGSINVFMSICGVILGVASLIVVMSAMNGFEREVRKYALGISSHGILYSPSGELADWEPLKKQIEQINTVKAIAPYLSHGAMINNSGKIKGVLIEGIIPELETLVTDIKKFSSNDSYMNLSNGDNQTIIGKELALKLKVSVGDDVTIMTPRFDQHGNFIGPSFQKLRIQGMIQTGMADYDNRILMTSLETSQRLFSKGTSISGFRVKLNSAENAPNTLRTISLTLPNTLSTIDWTQYNYQFFKAIQSQKRILFVVLLLIVVISSFSIASNVLLMVHKKAGTIAILKALGATKIKIASVFLLSGSAIGFLGASIGTLLGWLISQNAERIVDLIGNMLGRELINPDVYLIDHLPTYIRVSDIILIFLSCLVITMLASVYPAYRASSVSPVKGLAVENWE